MKIFLYVLVFFSLNTLCKYLTDDFSQSTLQKPCLEKIHGSPIEANEIEDSILNQKYTYLGKGKQAHVFVSEDGSHVLKLFRSFSPKLQLTLFGKSFFVSISKMPFSHFLFSFLFREEAMKQRELDFRSYINSFILLKKETQIEYLHLVKTENLKKEITLYDKIGVVHKLNLDETCFLIQRKAEPLYPVLKTFIQEKKEKQAQELIQRFVQLSISLAEKGIINPTTIEKNYGYLEGYPLLIDVGRVLNKEDLRLESAPSMKQVYNTVHHMKKWLELQDKDMYQYFEKILDKELQIHETAL